MAILLENLREKIPETRRKIDDILEKYRNETMGTVTVKQIYGGMRGLTGLVCDSSYVDPQKGLFIRGIHISELTNKLPEEIFYLLCTGELPDAEAVEQLQKELYLRAVVPDYVWRVIYSLPRQTHPLTMLSMAILSLEGTSFFKEKYAAGLRKADYWEATLYDTLELLAKLPILAAGIYRYRFSKGELIPYDPKLDWGANFANMLGIPDPDGKFAELVKLYLMLHSDHEGGNVSAFAAKVVNSSLSNLYYAVSAGLNGLAGPLHGLANQESLKFVMAIEETFNRVPSDKELEDFIMATLHLGKVIPGYGHAVLRVTDPRFTAFLEFGEEHCQDDRLFQIVKKLYKVVPGILKKYKGGKISNPWPNVDAISGALLFHFGMQLFDFYTVMFGVARVIGFSAQAILGRGLQAPIIRPKSVTNEWVLKTLKNKKKK